MSKITEAIKRRKAKKSKKNQTKTLPDFTDIGETKSRYITTLSEIGIAASEAGRALRLFASSSANFAIAMQAAKSNYDRAEQSRIEMMLMGEPIEYDGRVWMPEPKKKRITKNQVRVIRF